VIEAADAKGPSRGPAIGRRHHLTTDVRFQSRSVASGVLEVVEPNQPRRIVRAAVMLGTCNGRRRAGAVDRRVPAEISGRERPAIRLEGDHAGLQIDDRPCEHSQIVAQDSHRLRILAVDDLGELGGEVSV
jgi:hypothetical protein